MEASSPLSDAGSDALVFVTRLLQRILARGASVVDLGGHLVGQDPKPLKPGIHHIGEFVESRGCPKARPGGEGNGRGRGRDTRSFGRCGGCFRDGCMVDRMGELSFSSTTLHRLMASNQVLCICRDKSLDINTARRRTYCFYFPDFHRIWTEEDECDRKCGSGTLLGVQLLVVRF